MSGYDCCVGADQSGGGGKASLSVRLKALALRWGEERIRLGALVDLFRGRAVNLLVIVLALPFLIPVPLPLLSTPFGIVIALTGFQIAMGRRPWVPDRWASKELPAGLLPRILKAAGRVTQFLEWVSKPRWVGRGQLRSFHRLTGLLIAFAAMLLLLPLPVPLSNLLPATAILLFATASLRRDGLCLIGGGVMLLVSVAFFGAICVGGVEITHWIWK